MSSTPPGSPPLYASSLQGSLNLGQGFDGDILFGTLNCKVSHFVHNVHCSSVYLSPSAAEGRFLMWLTKQNVIKSHFIAKFGFSWTDKHGMSSIYWSVPKVRSDIGCLSPPLWHHCISIYYRQDAIVHQRVCRGAGVTSLVACRTLSGFMDTNRTLELCEGFM